MWNDCKRNISWMRNQEMISALTKAMPNNSPTTVYLKLYYQGCCKCDSFTHMVSSERAAKSALSTAMVS